VKTFGKGNIEWRDTDGVTHVIVATKGAAWEFLCRALPANYVTWDSTLSPPAVVVEEPTAEPIAWVHDRAKITCPGCLAALDGAVVERVKLS
jgi:hypothetical protein